jgi:hypothetical protein
MGTAPGAAEPDPVTWAELPGWVKSVLSRVELTEDCQNEDCQNLVARGHGRESSCWLQNSLRAMLALQAYADANAAKAFAGDFKMWCNNQLTGRCAISASNVSLRESPTVCHIKRHSGQRVRRVPVTVDPSGRVFMGAHIRIGRRGRLHYYDDMAGTGKMYVGYIGSHLSTSDS